MAVLYVGDSLFKYVRINRSGSDVRFSNGARIEHLSAAMSDIKEFQGVVLHAGTNNLPYETSEKVIRRFQDLIGNIRMENPEIQVYVSSILPRDISFFPGAKNNLKFLDRCNQRAKEVIEEQSLMRDIVLIEHPRFGSDCQSANRNLLSRDGLHLTTDGVLEMKRDIETAVRFTLKQRPRPVPSIRIPTTTQVNSFSMSQTENELKFSDDDFPALPTKKVPKKEVPVQKKEVPVSTPTMKEVPAKKNEVPAPALIRKEVPIQKKKVPVQKKEVPVQKKEVPVSTPTMKEVPAKKNEVSAPAPIRKEVPIQKKKVPVQKKEVPVQKKEVPVQKKKCLFRRRKKYLSRRRRKCLPRWKCW